MEKPKFALWGKKKLFLVGFCRGYRHEQLIFFKIPLQLTHSAALVSGIQYLSSQFDGTTTVYLLKTVITYGNVKLLLRTSMIE